MKLEVGMLLRTKEGIRKIEDVWEDMYDLNRYLHNRYPEGHPLFKEDIGEVVLKVSHNIIDLIEAGDYVNGREVAYIDEFGKYIAICETDITTRDFEGRYEFKKIKEQDIKSIVTKEQFEQMQYKVGE